MKEDKQILAILLGAVLILLVGLLAGYYVGQGFTEKYYTELMKKCITMF